MMESSSSRTNDHHNSTRQNGRRRDKDPPHQTNAEERRTERTRITTRETLTGRHERHGPTLQQRTPAKPSGHRRAPSIDPRQKTKTNWGSSETPKPISTRLWNPVVSLTTHTSAPLAPMISIPPLQSETPHSVQPIPLHELSLEAQEAAIIEDLLFVFMGYEGQYIRFKETYDTSAESNRLDGPGYSIMSGLDPSLRDLTKSMLTMGTCYKAIDVFVEVRSREEFGTVSHALCASIRKVLQDYLGLITQLETQFITNASFTLHVLNLHTLPTNHMLQQIYSLAHEILRQSSSVGEDGSADDIEDVLDALREGTTAKICKGGSLLGLITKRLELKAGDPPTRSLLTRLLKDASRPYMTMLNEWLHRGRIEDPAAEFMVRELKSIRREKLEEDYTDDYWDRRYRVRDSVPPQLESVKEKILLAGKYLNVVHECGGVDKRSIVDAPQSFEDPRFLDNVKNAYAYANEALLKLLLTTYNLPTRLRSLKHYFFLDRSDFISSFLELGTSELRKPVDKVNTSKLQSLLDLVLHQPGSLSALDPYKEDIKVEINGTGLVNSLTRIVNISGMDQSDAPSLPAIENEKGAMGFTSIQLDCSVPFPVSLVISRKTIWRYQVLFRYLLSLHHLEQQLMTSWQASNRSVTWYRKGSNQDLENLKRRVLTLRARMIAFVQQLLYFCTSEVIEPNWQEFMEKLNGKEDGSAHSKPKTSTVDELMTDHVDFLDTCLKGCMLTNSDLLRLHSKLMYTCTIFTTWTSWFSHELLKSDPDLSGTERPASISLQHWAQLQSQKKRHQNSSSKSSSDEEKSARVVKMHDILEKCEANFGKHLQILLDRLNLYAATETTVLFSLCAKLSTVNDGTVYRGLGKEVQNDI